MEIRRFIFSKHMIIKYGMRIANNAVPVSDEIMEQHHGS
jgi:hypothetical protein